MAFKPIYSNNPYYRDSDRNAFRQAAMKEPKFALGEILGRALAGAYANNYNNRGISKAVDKALAEYGAGGDVAADQAALQQVQQQMLQPLPGSVNAGMSDADALASVRQNYGLEPVPIAGDSITAGSVPVGDQMAQALKTASDQKHEERAQFNSNPSAYNEAMRIDALRQQVPNATAPAETIAQLAQMPGAAIMAQDYAGRHIGDFNKKEAMLRAEQQMLKDRRTPYQIEQALRILEPHFDRMQDDAYRVGAEKVMAELGATDEAGKRVLSDAEYKQKIIDLATRYGDIGKAAANVYGRDIVSGQDQFRAQQQLERENRAAQRRAAERAADRQTQIDIARIRGGNRTGGSVYGRRNGNAAGTARSPLDSAEFKYMDNMVNRIAEVPETERTPEQKRFFDQYKPLRDQIVAQTFGNQFDYHTPEERGATPANQQRNFNFNNYDQAVQKFQALAKSGKFNRSEVERFIRSKYGLQPDDRSNKFVEDVINGIEW